MRYRFLFWLGIIAVFSAASLFAAPLTPQEIRQGFRDNTLIVKLRAGAQPDDVVVAETVEGIKTGRSYSHLSRLKTLELPVGETTARAISRLRATGRYELVERDFVRRKRGVPNDQRFLSGEQWPLRNIGQTGGTAGADIRAIEAWDIRTDASNIVVAVIDSGMRTTHFDLVGNLWRNTREIAGNRIDDDNNGYVDDVNGIDATLAANSPFAGNIPDPDGHGTGVASVIGATGNNSIGMAGVAWRVQLMPLRFLDDDGYGTVSDGIECINYAIAHGAHVINASYGAPSFSQTEFDAIARARDAGIIFVTAADNGGLNSDVSPDYPANYLLDNIVTVTNTTRTDLLADSGNYSSGVVDLGAPGTSILICSNLGNEAYQVTTGTSFATPHVTGAIALLKAQFPGEHYRETINRVLRSVVPLAALNGKTTTGGRLNLASALSSTSTRPFNDDFAQRSLLVGETLTARGSSRMATRETGEPAPATIAGGASIWWTWVAPRSGTVTISTTGSGFDTVLGVYTGSRVDALTLVASNDDESVAITASKTTFAAVAGTTYHFVVDGKNAGAGLVALNVSLFSANDAFASAQTVSGRSFLVNADNRSATRETGEPTIRSLPGGHSVWYRWIAPATRRYYVSAWSSNSDFNTMLAVYSGTSLSALSEIVSATSSNGGDLPDAAAGFSAVAGTTYYIVVDSEDGKVGAFNLSLIDSDWEFFSYYGSFLTPAVGADGTLYTADNYGYLYAINPDGTRKWRASLVGYCYFGGPAVAPDGTIYIGDDENYLYAYAPDGTRKWRYLTAGEVLSSPAIASDGTIYFRARDGFLYALNPDGTKKWSVAVHSAAVTNAAPSVAADGTIYVGSGDKNLYAFNPDGTEKWRYDTGAVVYATAALASDGTIYLGTANKKFLALKSDGTLKWSLTVGDEIDGSAAIGLDGTIYFGCVDKKLYAVSPDGFVRWSYAANNTFVTATPIVTSDGVIYAASTDGLVHALNLDGSLRRQIATGDIILGTPLLHNGMLYVPSFDYRLYAVDVGQVPASSAWPMEQQNPRRTGRSIPQTLAVAVQPKAQSATVGATVTFSVGAIGTGPLTYQWRFNGSAITGATDPSYIVDPASAASAGLYSVVITDSSGTVTSSAVALSVAGAASAPTITAQSVGQTSLRGNSVTLTVSASGTAPLSYQWLKNGTVIAGAINATLTFPSVQTSDAASYTVVVTNGAGSVTSSPIALAVTAVVPSRLSNLSILTTLSTPDESFTMGTVIGGAGTTGTKPLLVRAAGPALAALGVGGTLDDPQVELFFGSTKIDENDNWGGIPSLSAAFTAVGAFPYASTSSKDAAIFRASTTPGSSSIRVTGVGGTTGQVIAELYDSTPADSFTTATPRLINVSVLKQIGPGFTVGFVVAGGSTRTVLVRAVGPGLTVLGVPGVVADPRLTLYSGQTKINENEDWGGGAALTAAFTSVGAFSLPTTSKDAALLATLQPGSYSAQVAGASGLVLVEVYEVP